MKNRDLPPELVEIAKDVFKRAKAVGLDFWEVIFEVLDSEELNEVAAYGGFPTRYPHWKFGMSYEELIKGYAYGLSKIYELVINNDPCYAYLMRQNALVDQKLVMAHVCGHADFFKNNMWFNPTNRKMMDEMANHGNRIRSLAEKYGQDKVESFIDCCLSIDNLIDIYSPYIKRHAKDEQVDPDSRGAEEELASRKLPSSDYMDRYVNPPEFLEQQRRLIEKNIEKQISFPAEPQRDILLFLLEHAPLKPWQRTIMSIIREEAYYFAPQGMTKIMNEGWACIEANTRVYTNSGLLKMADVVRGCAQTVSDGEGLQSIYDQNIIPDQETVIIKTRRGLRLEGSTNHRLLMNDSESWQRLDEMKVGDRILIAGGDGLFGQEYLSYDFSMPRKMTVANVGERVGVSGSTVSRHINGRRGPNAAEIDLVLKDYYAPENQELTRNTNKRKSFKVPEYLEADMGSFLGFLVGDGHISRVKRVIGFTSGDKEQAIDFQSLCNRLFDLKARLKLDENRWRVELSCQNLMDFLTDIVGLTHGPSAREKTIPEDVLYSPEDVVSAFLRSYFDCDGHAGRQGVILCTASEVMSEQVQLLLMNFGILCRRRLQGDGVWHVHITGQSAKIYGQRIGFGLKRKTEALNTYLHDRKWFKKETWDDEIVSIEHSRADVYDISVSESHRYAAAGFINHNSYWHSKLMTGGLLDDSELIDYADRHSGTMGGNRGSVNPYKVGIELFRNIEERWDKGQFGKEWEECDDLERKQNWDTKAGKGKEKIFQARRIYNDVTFIDEFLTEDFCKEHKLFVYDYNRQTGEYVISSRDFPSIKNKLLGSLVNFGQPVIVVENANYQNRGELYLRHQHEDTDLKITLALDTLKNLHSVWSRPVHLETAVDSRRKLYSFDGKKHSERNLS